MNATLNPDEFALVLSVGGSPEPLIQSIRHYEPKNAIFIASEESNAKIREILEKTDTIKAYETIILSDYQNLLACVRDMREELPLCLKKLCVAEDTLLLADITGGTKVMSAALTLAMMELHSRFTYVGGNQRTKEGIGTVESGHEKIIQMDNPWDAMGLREATSLALAFNAGQYAAARVMADFLKSRDGEYRQFYDGLGQIITAFGDWDIFKYTRARKQFQQGLNRLGQYNNRRHKNFCQLYDRLQQAYAHLQAAEQEASLLRAEFRTLPQGCGDAYLRDLLANARRSAKAGHYDDAVARLYSAVEKTAKIALAQKGIDNSSVAEEIVARAGEELAAQKPDPLTGQFKLPLTASFKLLCALDPESPVATAYRQYEDDLKKALESRNQSLLAHGYNPVEEKEYNKLFEAALKFLNISETELPEFPKLDVKAILF